MSATQLGLRRFFFIGCFRSDDDLAGIEGMSDSCYVVFFEEQKNKDVIRQIVS